MAMHWKRRRPSSAEFAEDVEPLPYVPAAFNLHALHATVPAADGGTPAMRRRRSAVVALALAAAAEALAAAAEAVAAAAEAAAAAEEAAAYERSVERSAERAAAAAARPTCGGPKWASAGQVSQGSPNKPTVYGGIRPAGSHSIVDHTRPGAAGTEGSWSYGKGAAT
eukprot:scaffold325_cov43-Phaeocystis_antarctica.AAC.1